MVLADTSLWIEHFRGRGPRLAGLLEQSAILMHPVIEGELACGNLRDRTAILAHLASLPRAVLATDEECRRLLEDKKLYGYGVGWLDIQLLAAALLSDAEFRTLDPVLNKVARRAGVRLSP